MVQQRILVVDDNPPFRQLVAAWLRLARYHVQEADDGQRALSALATESFDLILLDLQMEPMGGLNFMENFQTTSAKATPVILITADPSTDILLRASKMGFAGVMKKPVTEEQLLKMVKQQLDRQQASRSNQSSSDLRAV